MTFAAEARCTVGHDALSLSGANFAAKVGFAGFAKFAFAAFGGTGNEKNESESENYGCVKKEKNGAASY